MFSRGAVLGLLVRHHDPQHHLGVGVGLLGPPRWVGLHPLKVHIIMGWVIGATEYAL